MLRIDLYLGQICAVHGHAADNQRYIPDPPDPKIHESMLNHRNTAPSEISALENSDAKQTVDKAFERNRKHVR